MQTFSEMAEQWMRENMPQQPVPQTVVKANEGSMAEHDPSSWREDFDRWIQERCVHREGRDDAGGIGVLHVDFCEWAIPNGSVPCQRQTFEGLLVGAGFLVKDGLVSGLVLKCDLWALDGRPRPLE